MTSFDPELTLSYKNSFPHHANEHFVGCILEFATVKFNPREKNLSLNLNFGGNFGGLNLIVQNNSQIFSTTGGATLATTNKSCKEILDDKMINEFYSGLEIKNDSYLLNSLRYWLSGISSSRSKSPHKRRHQRWNKVYNEDYTKAVYQDYIKDYNKD